LCPEMSKFLPIEAARGMKPRYVSLSEHSISRAAILIGGTGYTTNGDMHIDVKE
jgi:hypothetical protein